MICPNCNHDNPKSNKFCAECGTKLEVVPSLMECSKCHNLVPADSKFCPDCGNRIDSRNVQSPAEAKQWSTLEDFKNGVIICDGVVLGRTTIMELRRKHYRIEIEHPSWPFYTIKKILDSNEIPDFFAPGFTKENVELKMKWGQLSPNSHAKYYINKSRWVTTFSNHSGCSFRLLLQSTNYLDEKGNAEMDLLDFLEDCGYTRSIVKERDEEFELYITDKPNEDGHYVFVELDAEKENIHRITLPWIREWKNYYTGCVTKID